MSAAARFNRIISMVAEQTRAERASEEAPTLRELAERHGVSERDVTADIRTLTLLGDHSGADWLLSLRIWQQEDRISISSGGPFRRPVRLSPEEQLAVQMALALDPNGAALASRLASLWDGDRPGAPGRSSGMESTAEIVRRAVRNRAVLEIEYAGESEREVRRRRIEPHQVAESGVRTYIVAWAEDVEAWRHFRLDRVVSARVTGACFTPRADFDPMVKPHDAFRPRVATDRVTVRFRADLAPWVTEYYAGHEVDGDGSVLVHFEAASKDWLVRRVLEFGPDAEVVGPAEYRAAMARAVA